MAISTLSKFTVPLANDQSAVSQGLLMPKLQYRFRVILENFGVSTPRSELTKQVIVIPENGDVHAFDEKGNIKWTKKRKIRPTFGGIKIGFNGNIYKAF